MPKVGFFPGSTIGNFEPHEACAFLRSAREILGQGAQMIIGVDLEKDERVLYDAYNDAAGVTARFNLNVLVRINRELGGNFDLSAFTHRAIYNRERHRIEMHLDQPQGADACACSAAAISFRAGESIHTESSYKYSLERFIALARGSGWTPRQSWTDRDGMFSVHALVASTDLSSALALLRAKSLPTPPRSSMIAVVDDRQRQRRQQVCERRSRTTSATMPARCDS